MPGRPLKLTHVLFVRVPDEMIVMLDQLAERLRKARPHTSISRAGIVRDLLWDAMRAELKAWDEGGRD